MTPETVQAVTFYFLATIAVISTGIVVYARNIVHSVVALFFTLISVAGFYALLGADFLAVTQVIVYVGGILALMLFGILLTSQTRLLLGLPSESRPLLTTIVGLIVFAIMVAAIVKTGWVHGGETGPLDPTVETLGEQLLGRYIFLFEFSSLTLLAALVGAAYLVRRDDR